MNAEDALESAEGSLENAEGFLEGAEGSLEKAEGSLESAEGSLENAERGMRIDSDEALLLASYVDIPRLAKTAAAIRDCGHGSRLTYSPKVFIPLTRYCQSQWDYCSFISPRDSDDKVYISLDETLDAVRAGMDVGCREVLFFLAAKPEHFSLSAGKELNDLGYKSTHAYLASLAKQIFQETGVLPKLHSGVLNRQELFELRHVSVAQGLMLDSRADYFCEEGEARYGSPHQHPHVRLGVVAAAGAMSVPFTSGIVVGIGESRRERIESLLALRELNDTYGHLQEIVIQDIRREPAGRSTRISRAMLEELLWTVSIARIIHGAEANIQAPADFPPQALERLLDAGINDWGGISPLLSSRNKDTHASSQLEIIKKITASKGKALVPRLPLYPSYAKSLTRWLDPVFHDVITSLMVMMDRELAGEFVN